MRQPLSLHAARTALALAVLSGALAACSRHTPDTPPPPAPAGTGVTPDNVPPAMVGVWTSTRAGTMRCIELRADGVYVMVPNTDAGDRTTYQGTWRVGPGQITWRDGSQNWQPDVNPMKHVADGHFVTVESDGSESTFDRIAGPGATCPRS